MPLAIAATTDGDDGVLSTKVREPSVSTKVDVADTVDIFGGAALLIGWRRRSREVIVLVVIVVVFLPHLI